MSGYELRRAWLVGSRLRPLPVADEGSRLAGAVLQKIEGKRQPDDFLAKHKRHEVITRRSRVSSPSLSNQQITDTRMGIRFFVRGEVVSIISRVYIDKICRLCYFYDNEGVVSAMMRNKSTSWPFGLACFNLRDSCMFLTIHGVLFFCSDNLYGF